MNLSVCSIKIIKQSIRMIIKKFSKYILQFRIIYLFFIYWPKAICRDFVIWCYLQHLLKCQFDRLNANRVYSRNFLHIRMFAITENMINRLFILTLGVISPFVFCFFLEICNTIHMKVLYLTSSICLRILIEADYNQRLRLGKWSIYCNIYVYMVSDTCPFISYCYVYIICC